MDNELTIEAAMRQLDDTIKQLENPQVDFSRGIELYGRAAELLKYCFKEFEKANTKITQLNDELEKAEQRLNGNAGYSVDDGNSRAEDDYE